MRKKTGFAAALLLMLGISLTACHSKDSGQFTDSSEEINTDQTEETSQDEGSESAGILSEFSTTDLQGNEIDQSILEDSDLTLVNVWATFCSPCIREMPDLGELSSEYKDKGLQIIGLVSDTINSDGSLNSDQIDTAKDIASETGADYLHLLPSEDLYGLLSQISAVPTSFFVDSQGKQVGKTYIQSMSKEEWEQVIADTMSEAGL